MQKQVTLLMALFVIGIGLAAQRSVCSQENKPDNLATSSDAQTSARAEAEKYLARMTPAKSFAYPTLGTAKFYVLTQEGVYSTEADEKELFHRQDALYPLFFAGNEVLIQLRGASERMNQTKKP
jgi:hypothetical protein